jgi:hypothetical protein
MQQLRALALCTLATLGAGAALAAPVNASAFGCEYITGFGFSFKGQSLKAPKGFLCHQIVGEGRRIRSETGAYVASPSLYGALAGRVCNWRIDFVYHRARDGRVYRVDRGRTHHACGYYVDRTVRRNKRLRHFGIACAALFVNGRWRDRQCHNITR